MKHTLHPKHTIPKNSAIDLFALLVGIIQPLTTIPQIYLVYTSKDVTSMSLFMWTSYNVASVILLAYGIKHRLAPIIWAQALWILVQTPIMVAIIIFR